VDGARAMLRVIDNHSHVAELDVHDRGDEILCRLKA
jgi:hypothetical protein